MKALSIRQPWAWLILNAGKDIENRNWRSGFKGRILIHAAKGMTDSEYAEACDFARSVNPAITIPPATALERGGIVGAVDVTGCWVKHRSPWFVGFFGFSLANPEPMPFRPCRGSLGLFDVPDVTVK